MPDNIRYLTSLTVFEILSKFFGSVFKDFEEDYLFETHATRSYHALKMSSASILPPPQRNTQKVKKSYTRFPEYHKGIHVCTRKNMWMY